MFLKAPSLYKRYTQPIDNIFFPSAVVNLEYESDLSPVEDHVEDS